MEKKLKAISYARAGLKLIPIWWINESGSCSCGDPDCGNSASRNNPGKHPIQKLVRNGRLDASSDVATVERWWSAYPEANIGLDCSGSNLFVVDVDLHDEKMNGFESLDDWETTFKDKINSKVSAETGGGGQHIYFTAPEWMKGGSAPGGLGKNYPGIDFKFNGYILLPPSNHKSGNDYLWSNENAESLLLRGKVPPLPASLQNFIKSGQDENRYSPQRFSAPARYADEDDVEQMRDALQYMNFFGMTDDERLKVGMGLQQALPGGAGKALYFEWLQQNLGSKFNYKFSERRWRSFKYRSGGRTIASFYEVAQSMGFTNEGKRNGIVINPDDFVYMEPTQVAREYRDSENTLFVLDDVSPSMTVDDNALPAVMAVDDSIDPAQDATPSFMRGVSEDNFKDGDSMSALFSEIQKVTSQPIDPNQGMPTDEEWQYWNDKFSGNKVLFSLFRYQVYNNSCFLPELAAAFALSTVGGLLAGRFRVDTLTTNLYMMVIAETSIGKSETMKMMSKVFSFAQDGERMGPKDIVSDKGFYNDLSINKARMFPIDEIGELFSTIFGPKANASQTGIKRALLDGFSAFGMEYNKTASKADSKNNPIMDLGRICPSIFGVTTPGKIFDAMSSADIVDGMMNRLLCLENDGPSPEGKLSQNVDLPKEFTNWFFNVRGRWQRQGQMFVVGDNDNCNELTISEEAKKVLIAVKNIETQKKRSDARYGLIWARLTELTKRVALIFEITERPFSGEINEDSVISAFKLVSWAIEKSESIARNKIADSEEQSIMKEVYSYISKHERGAFLSEVVENTRLGANIKIRSLIINALKDEQKIKEFSFRRPGERGRPKKIYFTPDNLAALPQEMKNQLSGGALEI